MFIDLKIFADAAHNTLRLHFFVESGIVLKKVLSNLILKHSVCSFCTNGLRFLTNSKVQVSQQDTKVSCLLCHLSDICVVRYLFRF